MVWRIFFYWLFLEEYEQSVFAEVKIFLFFQVSFVNFPKTLLCGEVHLVTVTFANIGSKPLHKLKLVTTNPKYLVLGTSQHKVTSEHIYHSSTTTTTTSSTTSTPTTLTSVPCDPASVKRVIDIDIPDGVLHPNTSVNMPLWMRGNDIGGIQEIEMLFYYEPAHQQTKPKSVLFILCSMVTGCQLIPIFLYNSYILGQNPIF